MSETANLYDNVYGDFGSRAEAAVRHDAFGDDIGQSSWITAAAWLRYADQAHVREHSHVLEVGSGFSCRRERTNASSLARGSTCWPQRM